MRVEVGGRSGPRWRAILEARWQTRLQEVTRLSIAYHGATAAPSSTPGSTGERDARRLLRQAVAARRRLADTEDALGRLTAGDFGRCEQCGEDIGFDRLDALPHARLCIKCKAKEEDGKRR